jgi:hypothetical protein
MWMPSVSCDRHKFTCKDLEVASVRRGMMCGGPHLRPRVHVFCAAALQGVNAADMDAFAGTLISSVWIDRGWFSGTVALSPSDGQALWDILQRVQSRAPLAAALTLVGTAARPCPTPTALCGLLTVHGCKLCP